MSNKNRIRKLEVQTNIGQELINEIQVEIINPDGTSGGTIISKKLEDGRWTDYAKQD